ncbi:MAG: tetratricopeptide repeat protein, partial [Nitrospiraceae bacterium]|nr:tetratricopeptide repeat protein [Nitrospiraceae bacterium]
QFQSIVTSPSINGLTMLCDENQLSPVSVMGYIAEKLASVDIRNKEFDERYKTYRTCREEIEGDPKAPRGALNLVVRGMTDFAIKAARRTPGVGVFAEYVNEKEAGEALTQGISYLIDRFRNKDEVQLLREPEKILTPLFMSLLNAACAKHRVVLMFDVFERTYEALEPWLIECLNFKYGECDSYLTFVISGRDQLDQHWTEIASSICHINLEPFIQEETRLYLANRGIIEESIVTQIHEDTGGLPVLIELLAGTNPKPGLPLPDISRDAVKRFLQWIPEEERRRVALLAAVPRQFNLDILSACLGTDAASLFNWLSTQSYIRTNTKRGWFYHEKVRELMLRYLHNMTPRDLEAAHKRLVIFFEAQQDRLNLNGMSASGRAWRRLEVERVYHLLSEQPIGNIGRAVNAFLSTSGSACLFSENIPNACKQVGREVVSREVQECASTLVDFYKAYKGNEHEVLLRIANLLSKRTDLDQKAQYALFARRGETYRLMGQYSEALSDFNRAIEFTEGCWAVAQRGQTYLKMGEHEKALSDFNRVLLTKEACSRTIVLRGETYRLMGRHAEALADFDRAIELDKQSHSAYEQRGVLLRAMERYEEAVSSLTEASRIKPECAVCFAKRGETYQRMGRYSDAFADFDKAIALDSQDHLLYERRSFFLQTSNRYEDAVNSFTEALKIKPDCTTCIHERGIAYRLLGKYPEALADFEKAVDLEAVNLKNKATNLSWRGEMRRRLCSYDEAMKDLTLAIQLDPENDSFPRSRRVALYMAMGDYDAANSDLDIVKQNRSEDVANIYNKAIAFSLSSQHSAAIASLKQAIHKGPVARSYALTDDLFESLKHMPEFQELMNVPGQVE